MNNGNSKYAVLYSFIGLGYLVGWVLAFSHLGGGAYLILAMFAALAYVAGQVYEMFVHGHLALSADRLAVPSAGAVTFITVVTMVRHGWLPRGIETYIGVIGRFGLAYVLGHVAGFGMAVVVSLMGLDGSRRSE